MERLALLLLVMLALGRGTAGFGESMRPYLTVLEGLAGALPGALLQHQVQQRQDGDELLAERANVEALQKTYTMEGTALFSRQDFVCKLCYFASLVGTSLCNTAKGGGERAEQGSPAVATTTCSALRIGASSPTPSAPSFAQRPFAQIL